MCVTAYMAQLAKASDIQAVGRGIKPKNILNELYIYIYFFTNIVNFLSI